MPLSTRHEIFAQEIAKGTSPGDAYVKAGYKPNPGNARRLKLDEAVMKRIASLLGHVEAVEKRAAEKMIERIAEKIAVSREWVIDRLIENVERAMQAEEVKDSHGKPTGEYRYEGNVANKALELLGKEIGMFVERRENLNVNYDIADRPLSAEEWVAEYTNH